MFLAAAMHVADQDYYDVLQAFLDAKDVVLFERVAPAAEVDPALAGAAPDELSRVHATRRRLEYVGLALERHRREAGAYPATLEELAEALNPGAGRDRRALARARADAWGRPLVYGPPRAGEGSAEGIELTSLGADGRIGGTGVDADRRLSDQPLSPAEIEGEGGLQTDLAAALDLVFQLDAVDYNGAQWRNSDMSIEEIGRRLDAGGSGDQGLFGALDGSSALTKIAGGLLRLLGSSRQGSSLMKVVGIELLARADELLTAVPGEMGALLEVLIVDRNTVVLEDLAALIEREPEVRTVAIFYGAGHMLDLEQRLTAELGYRYDGEAWVTALTVDVASTGLSVRRVNTLRGLIRRTIDSELQSMNRAGD